MLPILQFIFSSFWIWLGTAVLLWIVTAGAWRFLSTLLTSLAVRRNG
jgi:hypothetical protein